MLDAREAIDHWKADGPGPGPDPASARSSPTTRRCATRRPQNHELDKHFDQQLIAMSAEALERRAAR